jgi:hypothetical protein
MGVAGGFSSGSSCAFCDSTMAESIGCVAEAVERRIL